MKASSTYLSHNLSSLSAVTSAICSKSSMKSPATTGERGDPIAMPSVCSKNSVLEVHAPEEELCEGAHLLWCHGCSVTEGLIMLQSVFDGCQGHLALGPE